MKLIRHFDSFLKNEVNLDDQRLNRLNGSVGALTTFLQNSATFGANFIDVIPQGSYAHKTIIKPVNDNDEFDGDMLLYLKEFEEWEAEDYVKNLYACFCSNGTYKPKAQLGKRCVTIDYAGDFHVDVVPYLERHGDKFITHRIDNEFLLTNPEAYNAWLDEKNKITNRNLVKVIRLVKYLRNFKRRFGVKSVVLNVLLGQQVNEMALLMDPNCYADVPTTLMTIMNRLKDYVESQPYLPSIMDPSGTQENFSDRWDQAGYTAFRTAIIRYSGWINEAWSEPDSSISLEKWQRVFGDDFKLETLTRFSESVTKSISSLPVVFDDTEQKLEDLGFVLSLSPTYRIRIAGRVLPNRSMGSYYLKDRGNKVFRGRSIQFQITECTVPTPYSIYWKVRNRGPESTSLNCIRGQIEKGEKVWRNTEPTSFVGPHFVECYIVKNGVCVATDRQDVIIT